MTTPKKRGGTRPGAGRPATGNARPVKVTSAYTPAEAEAIRTLADGAPLATVQRAALLAVLPGEGGPFRPAGPEHTRAIDVAKGRSRKAKHKAGATGGEEG